MAKKHVLSSYEVIGLSQNAAADGDLSNNFDTFLKPTHIEFLDNVMILLNWDTTGTPLGVFHVFVSNDKGNTDPASGRVPTNWYELDFGSTIAINSSEDRHVININQCPATWIAFYYERTSGTGQMSAKITSKAVGG